MGQVLYLTLLTQVLAQCLKGSWFPQILREVRKSKWDPWSDCAAPGSSVVWELSASFLDKGHGFLPLQAFCLQETQTEMQWVCFFTCGCSLLLPLHVLVGLCEEPG